MVFERNFWSKNGNQEREGIDGLNSIAFDICDSFSNHFLNSMQPSFNSID